MGAACSSCSKADPAAKFSVDGVLHMEGNENTQVVPLTKFREVMKRSFKNPKDAFDMLDKDGDQNITQEEWLANLGRVGKHCSWDTETLAMMERYGPEFFRQMDTNNNGVLTFKEFKENLKTKFADELENFNKFREVLKTSFKNPKDAFDMLDRDGNQLVSRDEWLSTLAHVGQTCGWDQGTMSMMQRDGEQFFHQMDTNKNGELTFSEFKENLKKKLENTSVGRRDSSKSARSSRSSRGASKSNSHRGGS